MRIKQRPKILLLLATDKIIISIVYSHVLWSSDHCALCSHNHKLWCSTIHPHHICRAMRRLKSPLVHKSATNTNYIYIQEDLRQHDFYTKQIEFMSNNISLLMSFLSTSSIIVCLCYWFLKLSLFSTNLLLKCSMHAVS
jgi:hypothetical protein